MGEGNGSASHRTTSSLCDITAAPMYPHLISERVKDLRAEIETLTRANLLSLKGENSYTQEANRQRRAERLRDIMNELKALSEWKKV